MELTINIFLLILIITASFLCIYLIIYLKKFFEQVEAVRHDIHQLVERTIPILNNLEEVSLRANRMMTEVGGYWGEIDNSIRTLRRIVTTIGSWKLIRVATMQTSKLLKKMRSITSGLNF